MPNHQRPYPGNLTVTRPTCLAPGAEITGNVTVQDSGSLASTGATVRGNLKATGGTGLRLCGSTVGSLNISKINGVITIGRTGDGAACAANTVNGTASLKDNTGFLELDGNKIGGTTTVNNNVTTATTTPEHPTATRIKANTISGNLDCVGNTPPPTNSGQPNRVTGNRTGQCTGL